jgi:uridine kinase
MIGDILIIEEQHLKAVDYILSALEGKDLSRFVLAIGGESGSGKSETAHLIRRALRERGLTAKILHADNYYITLPAERTEWRKERGVANCVGLEEYRWQAMEDHIQAFRQGADSVELPFIDIVSDQIDTLITSFKSIDLLIIEGLYAVNAQADFRVLIDLTYHDTTHIQRLQGKEPINRFRAEVLEAEHKAVQSIREKADLVLSKAMLGLESAPTTN